MALPRCDTWPHAVKTPIRFQRKSVTGMSIRTVMGRLFILGLQIILIAGLRSMSMMEWLQNMLVDNAE